MGGEVRGEVLVLTTGRVFEHPAAVRAVKDAAVCKIVGKRITHVHVVGGDIVRLLVRD